MPIRDFILCQKLDDVASHAGAATARPHAAPAAGWGELLTSAGARDRTSTGPPRRKKQYVIIRTRIPSRCRWLQGPIVLGSSTSASADTLYLSAALRSRLILAQARMCRTINFVPDSNLMVRLVGRTRSGRKRRRLADPPEGLCNAFLVAPVAPDHIG